MLRRNFGAWRDTTPNICSRRPTVLLQDVADLDAYTGRWCDIGRDAAITRGLDALRRMLVGT